MGLGPLKLKKSLQSNANHVVEKIPSAISHLGISNSRLQNSFLEAQERTQMVVQEALIRRSANRSRQQRDQSRNLRHKTLDTVPRKMPSISGVHSYKNKAGISRNNKAIHAKNNSTVVLNCSPPKVSTRKRSSISSQKISAEKSYPSSL